MTGESSHAPRRRCKRPALHLLPCYCAIRGRCTTCNDWRALARRIGWPVLRALKGGRA